MNKRFLTLLTIAGLIGGGFYLSSTAATPIVRDEPPCPDPGFWYDCSHNPHKTPDPIIVPSGPIDCPANHVIDWTCVAAAEQAYKDAVTAAYVNAFAAYLSACTDHATDKTENAKIFSNCYNQTGNAKKCWKEYWERNNQSNCDANTALENTQDKLTADLDTATDAYIHIHTG